MTTYKSLNRDSFLIRLMNKIRIVSEKEYQKMKSLVNAYERNWRAKHPKEHKENSKALISSIVKAKKPKKVQAKKEQVVTA